MERCGSCLLLSCSFACLSACGGADCPALVCLIGLISFLLVVVVVVVLVVIVIVVVVVVVVVIASFILV